MLLSKSRYLIGRQCSRRLWLVVRGGQAEPALESEDTWELRRLEGAAVERLVERTFPDAIDMAAGHRGVEMDDAPPDIDGGALKTRAALPARRTIFQAYLKTDELLAIADILEPREGGWYMWEVKASTEAVAIHDHDLAFQVEAARRAGVAIVGAGLWLLNRDYVRRGELQPEELLFSVDRTDEVSALGEATRREVDRQLSLLREPSVPDIAPGKHCKGNRKGKSGSRPSNCGHLTAAGYCGSRLPRHWIGQLPRISAARMSRLARLDPPAIGRLDPDDTDMRWTEKQVRVIRAVKSGQPFVDCRALKRELDRLTYPVAYVDFEFDPGMGIPRFNGAWPYQRMPFQWSMLIERTMGAALEAPSPFLWLEHGDPRQPFMDSLLDALPGDGSIVVHSRAAEKTVLEQVGRSLGGDYPANAADLVARIFDTQVLLEAGYYHSDQAGSYSIKKVAPPLTGRGYDDLDIRDGMAAVVQWRQALDEPDAARRHDMGRALLDYCSRDTSLMHDIVAMVRRLCADAAARGQRQSPEQGTWR